MSFEIHQFEPRHYAQARALWAQAKGVGLSAADEEKPLIRYLTRNPGTSFVATSTENNEVIGTVLCGHDGRRGLIHHLAVSPEHRRQGIGGSLVNAGLAALEGERIEKCHLLVFAENADGLAFWASCGAKLRSELKILSLAVQGAA